ncbi:hypothetical protein AWW68_02005 [Roseivirga spongicola]|uniref:Response regulatory domain-containing protein n=1 Tax=Roseivirga spongicola TaxID=333140 RepID=A0A150XFR1_9BACT|nr:MULTISPECIES: response regulator [Roseivirga]KYG77569.1 hypothetical protein AWW68_02005 [Roseivirga spongicola]MBO6495394.1 response regulator [Roseivirga sp.]MBO6661634.1 response regulator [Roseivirga sp.]MBO6759579.1 response regulator [Roseivirga sp.]MBO6908381.1 response regulator [Roseivirga sp.]
MDRKTVLIVENEIIVADDISRLVNDLGHDCVVPVFSYAQAVECCERQRLDLVILDIKLNGVESGVDFATWLRKNNCSIPIIYLSVSDDVATKRTCELTEAHAYLEKPFVENELKELISSALQIQNEP